ncbi:MAG: LpqN/LpqT family lipoprotein [Mycobacterium sp.]|nr:LpqN/LpqT family lipoprotein [Mycobacterium sp.]
MSIPMRAGVIAIAAVALGIGLSGCGSDTKTEGSATKSAEATTSETSSEAPTTSAEASGPAETIVDYIKENNITETQVERGDPNAPKIDLPIPQGWEDAGGKTPDWAYGAIMFTEDPAMAQDPPTVIAILSKLTGDVDPAKILEYAPGEIQNLPDFQGPTDGTAGTLSGFDSMQIGGTYTRDGVTRMIAQKTVVIPGKDGLYVLQLNADGTEDQAIPLMDVTKAIDDASKITA